ncbi:urea ABC transporter permease subunit UrtB [Pelagovum pacificum]|uniref:Urea ABC transporter permease subunit UrtB n=1 Tax=Pelagovum pacificum TaxID=2588711 RepID=A0A5C5GEW6_9RHOB|nr:urea ABC transporter permease subunit UrtB [Pelagovum pacificum]QQA43602.1 urea ABC transporter permease subunit UrtB [Pelagovum pacificum]TNY33263.1 urea ABC transporter permease subunit UrtB [Pelagovum pacificum]
MIRRAALLLALILLVPLHATAQEAGQGPLQDLLQSEAESVADPSRRTIGEVLTRMTESGVEGVPRFFELWQNREIYQRDEDGLFFTVEETDEGYTLFDIATGEEVGTMPPRTMSQLIPNAGVRREIGGALVEFQLMDPDLSRRTAAVDAIARSPSADQLEPLRGAIEGEENDALKARKEALVQILIARFADDTEERIAAIETLGGDISLDTRAALNQLLRTTYEVAETLPEGANVARIIEPGSEDLSREDAYQDLVDEGFAAPRISTADVKQALVSRIEDGRIGDTPVSTLDTEEGRLAVYDRLVAEGEVPEFFTEEEIDAALDQYVFADIYVEDDAEVTAAASRAISGIETQVGMFRFADVGMDALSLASIYFLAAIGLAITFGVMGVINMAHGEFIMMGAYTGYVVQLVVPNYTLSIILALPLAFAVTFAAGVAMERLVIRWLYHRPLETLLATFGISIALQQLAKNIFGTQARPLTSPSWLNGAMEVNDVMSIAYIRIGIFVLALMFLVLILFVLNRTRLGLEVRAVTQNPGMAASMGINPDRINMLTFGLGSGIAGIAGVAIGLYAQVTTEMGSNYIVQSFMTVVVGGVGNVWGTLAGATLIGGLQKGIEWFNPGNTLAAQTYMILFIILFIQFRPKGIVALKGRAAGD